MTEDIYQQAVKDLATRASGAGRLDAPDAGAVLDNPLCGDRVALEIGLAGGKVARLAHGTTGCLLCRAAASAMAERAVGMEGAAAAALAGEMAAMLKQGAEPPFPAAAAFLAVQGHKSRHNCVLLPFKALAKALIPPPG